MQTHREATARIKKKRKESLKRRKERREEEGNGCPLNFTVL